eukprot:749217-Hanusia_phi.AAC.6
MVPSRYGEAGRGGGPGAGMGGAGAMQPGGFRAAGRGRGASWEGKRVRIVRGFDKGKVRMGGEAMGEEWR